MKVLYSLYNLTPKKKANRLSSMAKVQGVLLKGLLKDKVLFADYFPHTALGDRTVEEFLPEFNCAALYCKLWPLCSFTYDVGIVFTKPVTATVC